MNLIFACIMLHTLHEVMYKNVLPMAFVHPNLFYATIFVMSAISWIY